MLPYNEPFITKVSVDCADLIFHQLSVIYVPSILFTDESMIISPHFTTNAILSLYLISLFIYNEPFSITYVLGPVNELNKSESTLKFVSFITNTSFIPLYELKSDKFDFVPEVEFQVFSTALSTFEL
jgi:hypothetical protein